MCDDFRWLSFIDFLVKIFIIYDLRVDYVGKGTWEFIGHLHLKHYIIYTLFLSDSL